MAFRKRRHDSGSDSDEEKLPINRDNDDELKAEPSKKPRNLWSDMLMEEQLLEKGQKINLDKSTRKQPNVSRGPESYVMPTSDFQRKQNPKKKTAETETIKPVVLVTPASDDLFGDAPDALTEHFGVKTNDPKTDAPETASQDGWWGAKGANKRFADHNTYERESKKPAAIKKTSQLMAAEFNLETMLDTKFEDGLDADQFGNQLATALGEKDPDTIKKIVNAIGREVALNLFEETKGIEQNGGMNTADGSRRRTPGGVYITLFKQNPEITRETKNSIFGDMRNADKQRSKTKKKALNYTKKLEDMKKTMELAERAQNDLINEELGVNDSMPFDDNVADMV